ncbi:MAG: VWA domain-containing protein [Anaerolineales bacterium]|nr:VWA domain-containing protein [Anaerolineales bacterium]
MELLWPGFLYGLALIPLLVLVYIFVLRRRRPFSVRFSSLSLVREAVGKQSQVRRHLPFVLFLLAMSSLVLAMGRPVTTVTLPAANATVILSIDVSRSMCSTDIQPNRLEAAKSAALDFIEAQEANVQIGVVAFAGYAVVVQEPTTDRRLLETAIQNLTTARRTAIGSGLLTSLEALSEIDDSIPSPFSGVEPEPLPEGEYAPYMVVLLTDGVNTVGPEPLFAAEFAKTRGVRVYTIGFGTDQNDSPMNCGGFQGGPNDFSQFFFGGGGGGGGFRRGIDEETLKQVANMTGGAYFAASSTGELQDVFRNLPVQLMTITETTEISVIFAAIGAALIILAILLSMLWHPLS